MLPDKATTSESALKNRRAGRVNSIVTSGSMDGPGLRTVVFLQGCLFRCQYCHNPETLDLQAGEERTVDSLLEEIETYKSFFDSSGGGVTVSGGEPLLQKPFVAELFRECKERGIHTALDTNGFSELDEELDNLLKYTDLVILDLKAIDDETHLELTQMTNRKTLSLALYLDEKSIPAWVRHVVVHPYTDTEKSARELADFLKPLRNIERVELVPFHNLAADKWDKLFLNYKMRNTRPPSKATLEKLAAVLRSGGIEPVCG